MEQSQTEWDLYTGNIKDYVIESLGQRFGSGAFSKSLPICSAVNILKKIVNQKASVYKKSPSREFLEMTDEQKEAITNIYEDAKIDFQMQEINRLYELQKEQTHVLIEPRNGKLTLKPIKAHNVNVVPSDFDPERGAVYVFSAFDKSTNEAMIQTSDGIDANIADREDYRKSAQRFIWWSKDYHFVTDGKGEIKHEKGEDLTDKDIRNPIGMIPIVEISSLKDFTYWRQITNDVANFCIDVNADITMQQHIVELQGFSQAYLKGPESMKPQNIEVGANKIIHLITDPHAEGGSDVEFGYATPSSDIAASMDFYRQKIAMFLSSQGLDPDTVTGNSQAKTYNSGLERIVAEISKFEASSNTISLFKDAESRIFEVIKAWYNLATELNVSIIDKKYLSSKLSDDAAIEVAFKEPTAILSETDRVDLAERKQALGIYDNIDIFATAEGLSRDGAIEKMELMGLSNGRNSREENTREDENRTANQP